MNIMTVTIRVDNIEKEYIILIRVKKKVNNLIRLIIHRENKYMICKTQKTIPARKIIILQKMTHEHS